MRALISAFLIILGIVFLLVLCIGVYVVVYNPFGLSPFSRTPESSDTQESVASTTFQDKNPLLSPTQERALETVGVDPASLPLSITPEMKECFIATLGDVRVAEIIAGATPTLTDFYRARNCTQ